MNKEVEPSFSFFGQPAAMAFFFFFYYAVHLLEWMEEVEEEEGTCMETSHIMSTLPFTGSSHL